MADEVAKKEKKSFFKNVKSEFKKIIWTDKKTLTKQTIAVIIISVVICLIITLVDNAALGLIELIVK